MTDTDLLSRTTRRPSAPLRRALSHEWRQHRDVIAFHGVIAVILIQLAWLFDIPLGVVLILLAARLPADLADKQPEDGRMLRSSLGISRADAVRARVLVTIGGQLMLAAATAWIILVTDHAPAQVHWSGFDSRSAASPGPTVPGLWDHLADIGLWSGAILWSHALIGGEAFQLGRRPTGPRAIALYLGVCLLAYLVLMGCWLLASYLLMELGMNDVDGRRFVAAAGLAQSITVALTLGGGATALLLAKRRWIRRA